jgi:hypothetical protein
MRRKLLNLAVLLSMLLFVATMVLWVRSGWAVDHIVLQFRGRLWDVASNRGWVVLSDQPQLDKEIEQVNADLMHRARASGEAQARAYVATHTDELLAEFGEQEAFKSLAVHGDAPARKREAEDAEAARIVALEAMRNAYIVPARVYRIPFAAVALASVALPAVQAVRITRRRRRLHHGLCPVCGYDLRASVERCPECGAPATEPRTAA